MKLVGGWQKIVGQDISPAKLFKIKLSRQFLKLVASAIEISFDPTISRSTNSMKPRWPTSDVLIESE